MLRVRLSRRPAFRLLAVASSRLLLSAGTAAGSNAPHHQERLATLPGVGVAHRLGGLSSRRDWWVLSLLGSLGRKGDRSIYGASGLRAPGSRVFAAAAGTCSSVVGCDFLVLSATGVSWLLPPSRSNQHAGPAGASASVLRPTGESVNYLCCYGGACSICECIHGEGHVEQARWMAAPPHD